MSAVSLLTTLATEESTYIITATFTDEDGVAMTPTTVSWDLTDLSGTIINSRSGVSETPGTSVDIVLEGDDLAVTEINDSTDREITAYGTYNSAYGTGLPYKAAIKFRIVNLVAVP